MMWSDSAQGRLNEETPGHKINMITIIIIIIATIFLVLFLVRGRKPIDFPPGPLSLPLIGGLYKLGRDPFGSSIKLWHQYGPIVALDIASYNSIIINDYKLIKSAFNNPHLQGRPDFPAWRTKFRVRDGVIAGIGGEGVIAQENHRFAFKTLKEFGFGSSKMETFILAEISKIFKQFDQNFNAGKAISSIDLFNPYSGHLMWSLLSSRKSQNDTEHRSMTQAFNAIKNASGVSAVFMLFPWIIKMAPNLTGWNYFMDSFQSFTDIIEDSIKRHQSDPCAIGNDKDFIDLCLDEVDRTVDSKSSFYGDFGRFNLTAICGDLIAGGVDTVAVTMVWSLAIILNYPHIQSKIHNEIDSLELNEWIQLDHRLKLAYIDAFIKETSRYRPALLWGLPHRATEDVAIGSQRIPKGTALYANFFAVAKDSTIWKHSESFLPERFLFLTDLMPETMFPFSTGRRICPGRIFAQDLMFLIMANLLRQFQISGANKNKRVSLKPTNILVVPPHPFEFRASLRRLG